MNDRSHPRTSVLRPRIPHAEEARRSRQQLVEEACRSSHHHRRGDRTCAQTHSDPRPGGHSRHDGHLRSRGPRTVSRESHSHHVARIRHHGGRTSPGLRSEGRRGHARQTLLMPLAHHTRNPNKHHPHLPRFGGP